MMTQKFSMEKPKLIKIVICFLIVAIFWVMPAPAPMTTAGIRVFCGFISTVILLSAVDTVWPAMLAVVLLSRTGATTLNGAISGSLGNWVVYFVLMTFIMTHALNESGFTSRLVAKFMSQKFVNRNPWTFTISLGVLGMILGAFIDQVPAAAFMLAFVNRIYQELGYTKEDSYPHITNIITLFGVNIGGAMTPISHSLIILGLGVYESATGQSISLFTYLLFGIPTGIILFILMALIVRLLAKPDFSKFKDFDVNKVLDQQGPMDLREKVTVFVFFLTVLLWIIPGFLKLFIPDAAFVATLNSYGITFWAAVSVVLMGIISIDNRPLIDVRDIVNKHINWGILIFISIGVYFGSVICAEETGVNAFMSAYISPLISHVPTMAVVLIIAYAAVFMTNFASNVSTITVMTGLGVALGMSTGVVNLVAISMVTSFCGSAAYLMPSSFAVIAMLHGNEYSSKNQIYKYGILMMIITPLVVTLIGYSIGTML